MKYHLLGIFCGFIGIHSMAQQADTLNKIKTINLNETVISANRFSDYKRDIPASIQTITAKEIAFDNPQNSADMLLNTGSVFVQKSQQGGGSPVLRGFEASRILLVMDGVRMNNAIYRAGHLQDVITVDPSMIERTEVIFGPASTIYGSDALGGVIHFTTRNPQLSPEGLKIKTNAYSRVSSANREFTNHIDFGIGGKKFGSLTSFTYSNFGDMKMGKRMDQNSDSLFLRTFYVERIDGRDSSIKNNDPYLQVGSGYSQYDLLQKFLFAQSEKLKFTLNLQHSNSSNINRYDRLTEVRNKKPRFAEWYYGPQTRTMISIKSEIISNGKLFDKLNVIVASQRIAQDRISRNFQNNKRRFQLERVDVGSLNLDFNKQLFKHQLWYGAELVLNNVDSKANTLDISNNIETPAGTRYPDGGSKTSSSSIYISHRYAFNKSLIISDGIRLNSSSLSATFIDTTFYKSVLPEVKQSNQSITGNLGLIYRPIANLKLMSSIATGYRTPNVDDLGKVFDSSPGVLIIPNPNIRPESTINIEVGAEYAEQESYRIGFNVWRTYVNNIMIVASTTLNGKDSVVYQNTPSAVKSMQNAAKGIINGVTGYVEYELTKWLGIQSTATFTQGSTFDNNYQNEAPLDHISPFFGKTSIYVQTSKFQGEIFALYNGRKYVSRYSTSGEDNLQYATPKGMPGWTTYNVRFSYSPLNMLQVQASVENILDTNYRVFSSGINSSGRNFRLTLRVML